MMLLASSSYLDNELVIVQIETKLIFQTSRHYFAIATERVELAICYYSNREW